MLARSLRKRLTRREVRLWVALRALRPQGHHFRRQHPHPPYVIDFAHRRARLAIEVDGDGHGHGPAAAHDRARDAALAAAGWRTLRVWNREVDENLEGVIDTILAILDGRA